jgi:hypothetical protein
MSNECEKLLGKYRGVVINNIDPTKRGRLLVEVPDALRNVPSTWAEACLPLAGMTGLSMGSYFVPPVGAAVWIEFERGDVNRPIWTGCRMPSTSDVPLSSQMITPPVSGMAMETTNKNAIIISDLAPSVPPTVMPPTIPTGGVVLKSASGASIVVNDAGIFISNGKGATINMVGPMITVNNGALVIN